MSTTQTDTALIHKSFQDGMLIEVRDEGDYRSLYFDGNCLQSRVSLSRPRRLALPYTRHMTLPLLFSRQYKSILLIGVGSGSLLHFFHEYLPDCQLDGVDSSGRILDIARAYFQCPENERCRLHHDDGHSFLVSSDSTWDLILLDAFDGCGMANSIYNEPFLELCANHLRPGGTVSANLWTGEKNRLQELKQWFAYHFGETVYLPVPDRGNLVAIALHEPFPWQEILKPRSELRSFSRRYDVDFKQIVRVARQNNLSFTRRLTSLFS